MTVEPSWRIDTDKPTSADSYGVVTFEKGDSGYTVVGRLVPDTRLQAIEDADLAFVAALVSELRDLIESKPVAFNSFQWASRFRNRVLALGDLTEEER